MFRDIQYAARLLKKSPGFTVVTALTLGMGIGANVAIFSVINALLIRPLPAPHEEQLVRLYETNERTLSKGTVSIPNFLDWRQRNSSFQSIAGYALKNFALQGATGSQRVLGAAVSANYFQVLGVEPGSGRSFGQKEDQSGNDHVAIVSQGLCQRLYGGSLEALGRPIQLNNEAYTIVGIIPSGAGFPNPDTEVWIPLAFNQSDLQARDNHWLNVIGRLGPGISIMRAQQEMSAVAAALSDQYPEQQTGLGIRVISLHEDIVGNTRPMLWLLQSIVACMLLIAVINLGNLLLSRAANRRREIATRAALGASWWRIVQQLLAESLLLGAGGGILGIWLVYAGTGLFTFLGKAYFAHFSNIPIDPTVVGFTVLLSLLVGIICGLLPVCAVLGRGNRQLALRENAGNSGGQVGRSKSILAVCEISCALVILVCAGLLFRSFLRLQETSSGIIEPDKILTAALTLPPKRYPGPSISKFFQTEQDRVTNLPGVKAAGAINDLPLAPGHDGTTFQVEGWPSFPTGQQPEAETRVISGDYFQAAGIPLITGRFFDDRDGSDAPRVILINRTLALRFWKDPQKSIGHRINNGTSVATIIGVVGDVHQFSLAQLPVPEIYFPVLQAQDASDIGENDARSMVLVIRTEDSTDPATLTGPVRRTIEGVDPTIPLYRVLPWSDIIADSIGDRRLNALLAGGFAIAALLLSAFGLYGVISYGVVQRTREIGIRVALGAKPMGVIRLILAGGSQLAIIGITAGTLVSLFVTRLLQGFLYEVSPNDPTTFVSIILLLVLVAFVANFIPAHRATKISPIAALRE
jgi:putative ABC transport system permease protein